MLILNKFNNGAAKLEKLILFLFLSIMLVLGLMQVLARFVFQSPISWSEALLTYMFIWCAYIGAALGIYTMDHFRIDAFVKLLPEKVQKVIEGLVCLIVICFAVYMIRFGFKLAIANRTQAIPSLPFSMMIPELALPVSHLFILLHSLTALVNLFRKEEKPTCQS